MKAMDHTFIYIKLENLNQKDNIIVNVLIF